MALIGWYAAAGNLTYYPAGEPVPVHSGVTGDWSELVYRADTRGRQRVVRMVYEIATFQALRERLRCKEIWVVGADAWRNPDEDLPADFDDCRAEHYQALRKPLDPSQFIAELQAELRGGLAALNDALRSWRGRRSPSGAPARSGYHRWNHPRSRATCAGSSARSSVAGARCR